MFRAKWLVGWQRGALELLCTRPKPHERETHPRGVKPTGKTSAGWKCEFPPPAFQLRSRGPVTGSVSFPVTAPGVLSPGCFPPCGTRPLCSSVAPGLRSSAGPFPVPPLPLSGSAMAVHDRGRSLDSPRVTPALAVAVPDSDSTRAAEHLRAALGGVLPPYMGATSLPTRAYCAGRASFAAARRSMSATL